VSLHALGSSLVQPIVEHTQHGTLYGVDLRVGIKDATHGVQIFCLFVTREHVEVVDELLDGPVHPQQSPMPQVPHAAPVLTYCESLCTRSPPSGLLPGSICRRLVWMAVTMARASDMDMACSPSKSPSLGSAPSSSSCCTGGFGRDTILGALNVGGWTACWRGASRISSSMAAVRRASAVGRGWRCAVVGEGPLSGGRSLCVQFRRRQSGAEVRLRLLFGMRLGLSGAWAACVQDLDSSRHCFGVE
jgi:hypothetical protein